MIAIWPAGPPKLMQPSFSQNQNASASVGFTVADGVSGVRASRAVAASEFTGRSARGCVIGARAHTNRRAACLVVARNS